MKIVHLDGKPYAVNLWWQVRAGAAAPRATMLLAARETARELKEPFTCVALRPQQYGLGFGTLTGPNIPSLAAALRPQVPMNQGFLGVFRLEGPDASDGIWWVCGISRGTVAAVGDRLFDSEEDARTHVRHLRDLFGASEEEFYGTPEASSRFLVPLLTKDAHVESLFPDPARHRWFIRVGGLCLAVLLAGFGGKWLWDTRVQESALTNARQLMQSKEARRQEILAEPGKHFETSWLNTPPVASLRDLCLPELMAVPLSSNGWALESATCRPGNLVLAWGHRPGAAYTHLPREARLESPQKAVSRQKIRSLDPRRADLPLLTRAEATSRLYEITRQLKSRLKINWSTPEKKTVEEVEVTAPWVHSEWQLEAVPSFLLTDGLTLLGTLPGLSVTEILFDTSWSLKGVVYAHLK